MNSSEDSTCIRCIVSGKVQGVFYRASTREQASRLNIKGHAKNLSDGSVEVIASGNVHAVEKLKEWLHQGPKNSTVKDVECEILNDQKIINYQINNFKIL